MAVNGLDMRCNNQNSWLSVMAQDTQSIQLALLRWQQMALAQDATIKIVGLAQ